MFAQFKQGRERVEQWLVDDLIFTSIVVILVAVASFGLGRWSVAPAESNERPVLVSEPVALPAMVAEATTEGVASVESAPVAAGALVASVNGTKYHALDCPGAKQISEQNKLYFQTEQEARSAGYTPAANCSF